MNKEQMDAAQEFIYAIVKSLNHEASKAHKALQDAGIISPSLVTGINDLAGHVERSVSALVDLLEEEYQERRADAGEILYTRTRADGFADALAFLREVEMQWNTKHILAQPGFVMDARHIKPPVKPVTGSP